MYSRHVLSPSAFDIYTPRLHSPPVLPVCPPRLPALLALATSVVTTCAFTSPVHQDAALRRREPVRHEPALRPGGGAEETFRRGAAEAEGRLYQVLHISINND